MTIEVRLTGSVSIEGDGARRAQLSSPRTQVAFVRLTMDRQRGTTRDQLADTLWPGGLPNTWASALRSVVSRVRSFVATAVPGGSSSLVAEAGRYVLHLPDDAIIDVERAETAAAAAQEALGAGRLPAARDLAVAAITDLQKPLLPDHDGEWVAGVRQHLADALLTGLETASLAASRLGDHADALAFANEAVRRTPLRESAHRCRMTAHIAAGNRAEALRAYQRLRRSLADELGVDPAPETEAAYLELLGRPASVAPPAAGGREERSPGADPPFVGREAEMGALLDAWSDTARGAGAMVLVTGESGIGKTRLAAEAAHRIAQDGGLVLVGRCDRGSIVPYQPFTEALGGYLAATPADLVPRLSPATRRELGTLFPPGAAGRRPGSPVDRAALLTALAEVTAAATETRPILAVFDDLHQADGDTLLLLQHVLRRCAGSPLLIVATASDDTPPAARFAEAVHQVERDGALHRVPLAGLGQIEVRALVRHFLPDAVSGARPRPHALTKDAGGNPFLVVELLRAHRTDGVRPWDESSRTPAKIVQYVAARVAGLDPSHRDLMRTAAVAGPAFELDLVAHAAGVAPGEALDGLDGLLSVGLVTEATGAPAHPHRHRFAHDVVRRAVYEQLSEARRRTLHTRMADAVEELRSTDLGGYIRALADHRAAGSAPWGDRRAVRWGWLAADHATENHEPSEAVRLYQGALDHVPVDDHELRAEALTKLGLARVRAGHPNGDRTLLDGAIQARRCGRLDIAAEAAIGLGEVVTARPRLRGEAAALVADILSRVGADHLAGRARTGAPDAVDDLAMARLLARHAQLGGHVAPATGTTSAALQALGHRLRVLEGPDHLEHRLTLADELLALATAAQNTRCRVLAAHHRAMAAETTGEGPAREDALAALAAAAGESHLFGDALLADHAVALAVAQGRFTDAATTARLAAAIACPGPEEISPAPGSVAARQMLVAAWLRAYPSGPEDPGLDGPRHAADDALAALIDGDRGGAHLTVRALATGAEPLPAGDEWLHVLGIMGLVAAEVGDPTTAEAVRAMLTPYAHLNCGLGYRSFIGPASLHLGRLAIAAGDWGEAERHLTSALGQLTAKRAQPWVAVAQHALARALEARGRPSDRRSARALRAEARWSATRHGLLRQRPTPDATAAATA
jgi:DNA-binding SARP family transcriptional activator